MHNVINICMKMNELLSEVKVQSTWISDLTYNRPNKILTLQLSNGKRYSVKNISRTMFDRWKSSTSKGKFFHNWIKGNYPITRVK